MARARGQTSAQPLPSANTPVIDRYRRFTQQWFRFIKPLLDATKQNSTDITALSEDLTSAQASITNEATVRATNDAALATQINTVSASLTSNVATLNASIATETTARVAGDGALASQITTLTSTVNGNTTSIQQVSAVVDGIEAQWGVSINANGRVTGLVRLDSGSTQSTFTVLADRFIVANPNTPADTLQLFTTGTLAGVSGKVGVNAFFILDGTILARHIAVDSLSAITADIGTVTAGRIQSADGASFWDLDSGEFQIGG